MQFHNDYYYSKVSSANLLGQMGTGFITVINCGNTWERSGAPSYPLIEANEKGAFGSPSNSIDQRKKIRKSPSNVCIEFLGIFLAILQKGIQETSLYSFLLRHALFKFQQIKQI